MHTNRAQQNTKNRSFAFALGQKLAQYIGTHGLNNAQRALLLTNSRAFTQLMLGEMVIAGRYGARPLSNINGE